MKYNWFAHLVNKIASVCIFTTDWEKIKIYKLKELPMSLKK